MCCVYRILGFVFLFFAVAALFFILFFFGVMDLTMKFVRGPKRVLLSAMNGVLSCVLCSMCQERAHCVYIFYCCMSCR